MLAAAPLVPRSRSGPPSLPLRRPTWPKDSQVVDLVLLSVGSSNHRRIFDSGASRTPRIFLRKMARPERFELPTTWFEAGRGVRRRNSRLLQL